MAGRMKWNGKKFENLLCNATASGLNRAGTFYHQKCVEKVSRPNTGTSVRIKRRRRGGNRRSRTVYLNPSQPGEAPRLRTGHGRRHVVKNFNRKGMYVRVGIAQNAIYMFYLEVGTRRVARRPWLLKTLEEHHRVIGKLSATGGGKRTS